MSDIIVVFEKIRASIQEREISLRLRANDFRRYTNEKLWNDISADISEKEKQGIIKKKSEIVKHWIEQWYIGFAALLDEMFNIGYGLMLRKYQNVHLHATTKIEPRSGYLADEYTAYYDNEYSTTKDISINSYAGLLSALEDKSNKFR